MFVGALSLLLLVVVANYIQHRCLWKLHSVLIFPRSLCIILFEWIKNAEIYLVLYTIYSIGSLNSLLYSFLNSHYYLKNNFGRRIQILVWILDSNFDVNLKLNNTVHKITMILCVWTLVSNVLTTATLLRPLLDVTHLLERFAKDSDSDFCVYVFHASYPMSQSIRDVEMISHLFAANTKIFRHCFSNFFHVIVVNRGGWMTRKI